MRDSELVAAIVAGDPEGLAEAYDRYAAPLYTYCRSLLHEPADAADAVQDTFVIAASKLAGLRDQDRLRPWLYAVSRNECHRRLRARASQATTPIDEMPDVSDTSADVSGEAEREELRVLLRSAIRGLNAGEQDLIELQLRQGLDVGEIAAVLGVSRNHAHALLSRARDQLEISLGALLVARSGREDCAALDAMLQDWDGELTPLMRKRINRHIEQCPVCAERKRRELAPALLLGLAPLAALPIAAMPAGLRAQVLRLASSDTPDAVAHRASVAARTAPFGHHGFPKPIDPPKPVWWRSRQGQAAAAAVVAGVVAATLVGLALASGGPAAHGGAVALGQGSATSAAAGHAGATSGAVPGSPGKSARPTAPSVGVSAVPSPTVGAVAAPPAGNTPLPASASPPPTRRTSPPATPPPSSRSTAPSSPAPSTSTSPASTSPPPSTPPPQGLLSETPRTITLGASGGTLTLTASYNSVTWFIRESSDLIGVVTVAPSGGTLASGHSTIVHLSVSGPAAGLSADAALLGGGGGCGGGDGGDRSGGGGGGGGGRQCVKGQLTVNPGGITVTVIVDIGGSSSPPPGGGSVSLGDRPVLVGRLVD